MNTPPAPKRGPYKPRSEETRQRVNQLRAQVAASRRAGERAKYRPRSPEVAARVAAKAAARAAKRPAVAKPVLPTAPITHQILAHLPAHTPYLAGRRGLCAKHLHCYWRKSRVSFAASADFVFNEVRQFLSAGETFALYQRLDERWMDKRIAWLTRQIKEPVTQQTSAQRAQGMLEELLDLEKQLRGQAAANELFASLRLQGAIPQPPADA